MECREKEYQEDIEELRKEIRELNRLLAEFEAPHDVTQDPSYTTTELQLELEKYRLALEVNSKTISNLKSENAQLRHDIDLLEISKENVRFCPYFFKSSVHIFSSLINFSLP